MPSKQTVERAFELARGSDCQNIADIRRALKAEHLTNVDTHLTGPSLRRQLIAVMQSTRSVTTV